MTAPANREALIDVMARGSYDSGAWSSFFAFAEAVKMSDAILTAIEAAGVVVVPVEETEEMSDAAIDSAKSVTYR